MNANQVLSAMIEGLYRDTASESLPSAFGIAPTYATSSLRNEFLIRSSDDRFDARKVHGKASAINADFQRLESQYEPIPVQLESYKSGYEVVPDSFASSVAIDIIKPTVTGHLDKIYGGYIEKFIEIVDNDLPSGAAWNISVASAPVVAQINKYIKEITLASGKRPNAVWISEEALFALQNLDEIQSGTSISGFTSAGSAVRRTGSATPDEVYAFFKTRFGLDLFVEARTILNVSGNEAYAAGAKLVISHAAPGAADSCLKTFHLGTYGGSNFVNFQVERANKPLANGQVVTAEALYAVKATNPNAGLVVDLTLPS